MLTPISSAHVVLKLEPLTRSNNYSFTCRCGYPSRGRCACLDAATPGWYDVRSTGIPRNAVTGKDSDETLLTGVDLTVQRRWCFANSRRRLTCDGGNGDVIGCHVTKDLARVASGRPGDVIAQRRLLSPVSSIPTSRSRTSVSTGYKGA